MRSVQGHQVTMCGVLLLLLLALVSEAHANELTASHDDASVNELVTRAFRESPLHANLDDTTLAKPSRFPASAVSSQLVWQRPTIIASGSGLLGSTSQSRPFAPPFISHSPRASHEKIIAHATLPATRAVKERPHWCASSLFGNLPLESSIVENEPLTFMEAVEYQLELMCHFGFTKLHIDEAYSARTNDVKQAKIVNMNFKNEIFRKVRMTYVDAGKQAQVFNTVFYPSYAYDLPLFAIDLISLGRKRVLVIVDFQPLHPTEDYSAKYIDDLAPIRAKYTSLQGSPSGKIYNDTSFFSKNMLFGRYGDEASVKPEVLPAFKEYLHAYMHLAENAVPDYTEAHMMIVQGRQAAHDILHATNDPAIGMFGNYFGKDWSSKFVHDFLFELATEGEVKTISRVGSELRTV